MKGIILILSFIFINPISDSSAKFRGAWKSDNGVLIFAGNYFSYAAFSETEFRYTYGGSWKMNGKMIVYTFEFHTKDSSKVGTNHEGELIINKNFIKVDGIKYTQIDDGNSGTLYGAWLFSNRMRNGEMGTVRNADNPRKTMKILSGTRFQWIAYNTETKEFLGTGGGTYLTMDGKYTENIDFFSRDNSRVGVSLVFDYELKGSDWHHKGYSSKGDPIYEIWRLRE